MSVGDCPSEKDLSARAHANISEMVQKGITKMQELENRFEEMADLA